MLPSQVEQITRAQPNAPKHIMVDSTAGLTPKQWPSSLASSLYIQFAAQTLGKLGEAQPTGCMS